MNTLTLPALRSGLKTSKHEETEAIGMATLLASILASIHAEYKVQLHARREEGSRASTIRERYDRD